MSCRVETLMVACQRRRHKRYNKYITYDTYNTFFTPIPWRTQKELKGLSSEVQLKFCVVKSTVKMSHPELAIFRAVYIYSDAFFGQTIFFSD